MLCNCVEPDRAAGPHRRAAGLRAARLRPGHVYSACSATLSGRLPRGRRGGRVGPGSGARGSLSWTVRQYSHAVRSESGNGVK